MCRDSLTELGHAYEERSSNAKHHPPKKKKKTPGSLQQWENQVIWVARWKWKGVKRLGRSDYRIKTFARGGSSVTKRRVMRINKKFNSLFWKCQIDSDLTVRRNMAQTQSLNSVWLSARCYRFSLLHVDKSWASQVKTWCMAGSITVYLCVQGEKKKINSTLSLSHDCSV